MQTIDQAGARRRFDAELRRSGCVVVSEATLRSQDLLPKFMDALGVLDPGRRDDIMADVPGSALSDESDPWWSSEDCSFLLNEELFDALNEAAPEGFCFGSNEGDGACFGFWPLEDD